MPWTEIRKDDLDAWTRRLLQIATPLFQLPFWNEPLRLTRLSPRYLVYEKREVPVAYVCVLTLATMGFVAGVIRRGPVSLDPNTDISDEALIDLQSWAKRNRFVFVRFTHSDPTFLDRLERLKGMSRVDALPFYGDFNEELILELQDDDDVMLSRFQPIARREIKQALGVGYEMAATDTPEDFQNIWPLFERLAGRKGFQYRPLSSYLELVRQARKYGCVRLHTARLDGRIVEAILIVRDHLTAFHMSGALDVAALGEKANRSPSCLLHWDAMRDARAAGARYYNFGSRSGTVYSFKRKFHPSERKNPTPATLVLNPFAYWLWRRGAVPFVRSVWPLIRRTFFR